MNQQNYPITVALSSRRENFLFVSKTISWRALVKRCSIVKYTNETLEEYKNAQNRESYEIRSGFVGGRLREGICKLGYVKCRSIATMEVNNIPQGFNFTSLVEKKLRDVEYFMYSTHYYSGLTPEFRLVILFDRPVIEWEYPVVTRHIAKLIGEDFFAESSHNAYHLMLWPSASIDGEFIFSEHRGKPLPVANFLRFQKMRKKILPFKKKTPRRYLTKAQRHIAKVKIYLDKKLPPYWDKMGLAARRDFLRADDSEKSVIQRGTVCNMELWCECFCRNHSKYSRTFGYEITSIMKNIGGWHRSDKKVRTKYGSVPVWVRD